MISRQVPGEFLLGDHFLFRQVVQVLAQGVDRAVQKGCHLGYLYDALSLLDGILLSIPHIRVPAIAGLAVQVEHDTGLHPGSSCPCNNP